MYLNLRMPSPLYLCWEQKKNMVLFRFWVQHWNLTKVIALKNSFQQCQDHDHSRLFHDENVKRSNLVFIHVLLQMFCSDLEKLIQQLYSLSEKMELLATPSVDGAKSSVAEYQVRDKLS